MASLGMIGNFLQGFTTTFQQVQEHKLRKRRAAVEAEASKKRGELIDAQIEVMQEGSFAQKQAANNAKNRFEQEDRELEFERDKLEAARVKARADAERERLRDGIEKIEGIAPALRTPEMNSQLDSFNSKIQNMSDESFELPTGGEDSVQFMPSIRRPGQENGLVAQFMPDILQGGVDPDEPIIKYAVENFTGEEADRIIKRNFPGAGAKQAPSRPSAGGGQASSRPSAPAVQSPQAQVPSAQPQQPPDTTESVVAEMEGEALTAAQQRQQVAIEALTNSELGGNHVIEDVGGHPMLIVGGSADVAAVRKDPFTAQLIQAAGVGVMTREESNEVKANERTLASEDRLNWAKQNMAAFNLATLAVRDSLRLPPGATDEEAHAIKLVTGVKKVPVTSSSSVTANNTTESTRETVNSKVVEEARLEVSGDLSEANNMSVATRTIDQVTGGEGINESTPVGFVELFNDVRSEIEQGLALHTVPTGEGGPGGQRIHRYNVFASDLPPQDFISMSDNLRNGEVEAKKHGTLIPTPLYRFRSSNDDENTFDFTQDMSEKFDEIPGKIQVKRGIVRPPDADIQKSVQDRSMGMRRMVGGLTSDQGMNETSKQSLRVYLDSRPAEEWVNYTRSFNGGAINSTLASQMSSMRQILGMKPLQQAVAPGRQKQVQMPQHTGNLLINGKSPKNPLRPTLFPEIN